MKTTVKLKRKRGDKQAIYKILMYNVALFTSILILLLFNIRNDFFFLNKPFLTVPQTQHI